MTATQQLTAPASVIVGVPMMDEGEAREYVKMMRWDLEAADQALTNFRARAFDFADRQGWKALGYGGALEALQTELGAQYSKSYLSRILQAAEIERVLDLPIGQLPERTIRPLAQLDTPDQQRSAWQQAVSEAGSKRPTAKTVQQAVEQIKPSSPPEHEIVAQIRAQAAALGLGLIWEDDTVILHWPDEDIDQLMGMGYTDALHWLATEGAQQAEKRATQQPPPDEHADDLNRSAASDSREHKAQEAADAQWLDMAEIEIASGNVNYARQLLGRVSEASAYRRDQLLSKLPAPATGRQIALALSPDDCAALLREARVFSSGDLTKKLPAIGQLLVLVVEGIKGEVTE